MTRKADFDADQWTHLTSAPALAALAVAAADKGGALREQLALARTYAEARQAEHTPLIEALLTTPPELRDLPVRDPGALADSATSAVRRASDLLREVGTEAELAEFGDFVMAVCTAVAAAHKEGGILGFGGKAISDPEQALIDRIALSLGERPGAPPAAVEPAPQPDEGGDPPAFTPPAPA